VDDENEYQFDKPKDDKDVTNISKNLSISKE